VRGFAVGNFSAGDEKAQGARLIRALRERCRCAVRGAARPRMRSRGGRQGGSRGRMEHRLNSGIMSAEAYCGINDLRARKRPKTGQERWGRSTKRAQPGRPGASRSMKVGNLTPFSGIAAAFVTDIPLQADRKEFRSFCVPNW
jgi:hypothetical protein